MKTQFQVQLEREDFETLQAWAALRGISLNSALHRLIQGSLPTRSEHERHRERFLAAAGAIRELPGDDTVSEHHDRFLYAQRTP